MKRLVVVAVVAVLALGVLAASGLDNNLVYYRTPTELSAQPSPTRERVRLGGMVVPGSISERDGVVRFVLSDGATDVTVNHSGNPRGVFQEGQGALVEGQLLPDGTFRSDVLMVKHDNTYRPPEDER